MGTVVARRLLTVPALYLEVDVDAEREAQLRTEIERETRAKLEAEIEAKMREDQRKAELNAQLNTAVQSANREAAWERAGATTIRPSQQSAAGILGAALAEQMIVGLPGTHLDEDGYGDGQS